MNHPHEEFPLNPEKKLEKKDFLPGERKEIAVDLLSSLEASKHELNTDKLNQEKVLSLIIVMRDSYDFINKYIKLVDETWFKYLYASLCDAEVVYTEARIAHFNKLLRQVNWDKKTIDDMKVEVKELNRMIIPSLEDEGQKDLVNELRTCIMAIEMKIKSDRFVSAKNKKV